MPGTLVHKYHHSKGNCCLTFLETLPCTPQTAAAASSKMQDLIYYKSVANDTRLLGCDTAVIGSAVTSVSKDHSAFIYKVRQSLNPHT